MIAATTEKLLQAGRAAFARDGFAATNMDALTADAGLTRGALYHHFCGKEGLFEAVVRQIDGEIAARIARSYDGQPDKRQAFRDACTTYLDCALDPEIQRIMFVDAPAVLGQRLRDIDAESSLDAIRGALDELSEATPFAWDDKEALARMLNAAMIDLALWIAASNDQSDSLRRARRAYLSLLDSLGA